jgi:hypothetical protein
MVMGSRLRGSRVQWIAAAACAAWIITILPALSHPYLPRIPRLFGGQPDWREWLLGRAAHIGTFVGAIAWGAWAQLSGVLKAAHGDFHFVPLTARGWFTEALTSGPIIGMLVMAALPPWLVCLFTWFLSAGDAGAPRRGVRAPSFVIAGGWTLALATALVPLLAARPSWLLLPPRHGDGARAPLSEWCVYSLHARARECETVVNETSGQGASGFSGFVFAGARCVPVADVPAPLPRDAAIARTAAMLERELGSRATVRRSADVGGERVDLVVSDGTSVLLAMDVEADAEERQVSSSKRARLAAAGIRDYWRLTVHPNRDPMRFDDLEWWRIDKDGRELVLAGGSGRNEDVQLRLTTVADFRLPIDDLLPIACSETPAPRGIQTASAVATPRPIPSEKAPAFAFVVDGTAPMPELTFGDVDSEGMARHARFTATSTRPVSGFDPAATGIAVHVRSLFEGQGKMALQALLPAGRTWRADSDRTWKYRDAAGTVAGITEVTVSALDDGRLAWQIDAARAGYRVVPAEVIAWGNVGVRLGAPSDVEAGGGAAVFFMVHGPLGCAWNGAHELTCRVPEPDDACSTGPDIVADDIMRCVTRRLANGQERFFATHGRYFGGSCADLLDGALPDLMTCISMGSISEFKVMTMHLQATHRQGCTWRSPPPAGAPPLVCS